MKIANALMRNGAKLRWRSASAMTLVEVLISSSIGLIVLGSLLGMTSVVAKEERREMVDANLQQQANLLEDKITRLIRSMSASQAVILGNAISQGSPFYRSVIVARGPAPAAREKLAFNSDTLSCWEIPDLDSPATQVSYFGSSSVAVLRSMYFFISEKLDGAPDASALTVYFQMDDAGMASSGKTNSITRSFTATMRNN